MAPVGSDLNGLIGRLTTWTNAVLLVVLALTIGVVLYPNLAGAVGAPAAPAPAYPAGSRIDTPAEWHKGSDFTLVLFAQARCAACQRAQPFLKDTVARFADRAPVVFVSPGADLSEDAQFAASLGLEPADTRRAPAGIRVRVTPTLVLVDRTGVVLRVWEGVPPDDQPAIMTAIERVTGAG